MIRDRNLAYLRQRRRIPWNEFNLGVGNAAAGDGGPVWGEISTFHYGGILAGAANDEFSALDVVTPTLWDPREEIGVRVGWCVEGTVATDDAILWRVNHDQADPGEVLADPIQGTGTALDTAILIQSPSVTTTLMYYQTSRGVINASTFDMTSRRGVIAWQVDVQTFTQFTANEPIFLYLEIDYIPLLMRNAHEQEVGHFANLGAL